MAFVINSTNAGVLLSNKTTAQKNAIGSPATGLIVYDTDLNALNIYANSAWNYSVLTTFCVPWTSFQYLIYIINTYKVWTPSSVQNGGSFTAGGTNLYSYGSCTVSIPVKGTWRITAQNKTDSNSGITRYTVDGVNTDVDTYTASPNVKSYSWTQTLDAKPVTVAISNNGKNASSSSYWTIQMGGGLLFQLT